MGKRKHGLVSESKSIPHINSANRKLAAKRLEQLNPGGLPTSMREIKCQAREPLAPICSESENSLLVNSSKSEETNAYVELDKNNNSDEDSKVAKQKINEVPVMMTKQPSIILDDNIFTFKPKVSTASARLVENLGTDFMTRQQQHLEKQKKFVSMLLWPLLKPCTAPHWGKIKYRTAENFQTLPNFLRID